MAMWSPSQDEILNAVLASISGGLVRELYRDLAGGSGNLFSLKARKTAGSGGVI